MKKTTVAIVALLAVACIVACGGDVANGVAPGTAVVTVLASDPPSPLRAMS